MNGMTMNRTTANGSFGVQNNNGAHGNGSSGNGANGNGANGNGNSNGPENGNGNSSAEYAGQVTPRQIARGFAPPNSASNCVHLHIAEQKATADILGKVWNICRANKGETEVWLHLDTGEEMLQLRVSHAFWVEPSPQFCQQVLQVLGEGCVLAPCG